MGGAFLSLGSHSEDPKRSLQEALQPGRFPGSITGSGAGQEEAASTQILQECLCPFQQSKHTDMFG